MKVWIPVLMMAVGMECCFAMPLLDVPLLDMPVEERDEIRTNTAWRNVQEQSAAGDVPTDQRNEAVLALEAQVTIKEIFKHFSRSGASEKPIDRLYLRAPTQTPVDPLQFPNLLDHFLSNISINVDLYYALQTLFADNSYAVITVDGKIIALSKRSTQHFNANGLYRRASDFGRQSKQRAYQDDGVPLITYLTQMLDVVLAALTHPLAIAGVMVLILLGLPIMLLMRKREY